MASTYFLSSSLLPKLRPHLASTSLSSSLLLKLRPHFNIISSFKIPVSNSNMTHNSTKFSQKLFNAFQNLYEIRSGFATILVGVGAGGLTLWTAHQTQSHQSSETDKVIQELGDAIRTIDGKVGEHSDMLNTIKSLAKQHVEQQQKNPCSAVQLNTQISPTFILTFFRFQQMPTIFGERLRTEGVTKNRNHQNERSRVHGLWLALARASV